MLATQMLLMFAKTGAGKNARPRKHQHLPSLWNLRLRSALIVNIVTAMILIVVIATSSSPM